MFVRAWACVLLVILTGVVVNAYRPPGTPRDHESARRSFFRRSSSSHSSSRCRPCNCRVDSNEYQRCNDVNAIFKNCPNPCPNTCDLPGPKPCDKACVKEGCECKEGFYLDDRNKCVKLQDCPGASKCSANETFVFCKAGCPTNYCPQNDNRFSIACSPPYPCQSGCSCKEDYLRSNEDDTCILYSDCPPLNCTRPNEVYCARPPPCIFDKCEDLGKPNECNRNYPSLPQCVCKPGHYRNKRDICVPKKRCRKPPPTCGLNEVPAKCKIQCPPQSCESSYTDYSCPENIKCEAGCNCRQDYLRNATGHCIPNEQCPLPPTVPICKENEQLSSCKIVCPPQSCASLYTLYLCQENITCEWGCNCIDGYLRDDKDVCIPSTQCSSNPPDLCGYNEDFSDCAITCPPQTCDSIFTSYMCSNETVCEAGCNCFDGYLRNASNICVPSEKCFLDTSGCNGDPNAEEVSSPWSHPSTCDSPEASSDKQTSKPSGCQCKPGYILSYDHGKCILPDDCECGNPCGANGTFSECAFRCPNQYCPEDDSQVKVACKPGRPCPSGCLCKPYHLKKSYDDESCVLASDCPRRECTRPNEVWNPCASECLAESCDDLYTKPECYPDPDDCQPQCVCKNHYYRNKSGICIPKEDCPAKCEVNQECRPTCAVPNPPDCSFLSPANTNVDSCNCQSGYVLSYPGGTCIKIEDCPSNQTCNGDPNAFIKECPQPCSSSCQSPNAFPCKRKCDPIGCQCKPGYLKSDDGKCILPDQCPGGNPCGENEDFVANRFNCPTNYCPTDNSRATVVCEDCTFGECFSGCACRLNHRRFSIEDPKCIVSSDCPPVDCSTRPNEKWSPCPSECTSEYCEAVDNPPSVCNTFVLNCSPMCRCEKGYFRNGTDICVSARECRRLNKEAKLVHIGLGN